MWNSSCLIMNKGTMLQTTEKIKNKYTNFRGWTSKPNTPESDMQRVVMHTVAYDKNGISKEMEVLAECPVAAINSVRNLLTQREHL